MADFRHIPQSEIQALHRLSESILQNLQSAGLPALIYEKGKSGESGAIITIDTGLDSGSGVYVRWKCHKALVEDVSSHLLADEFDHSTIHVSAQIQSIMRDALMGILTAVGFDASISNDDTHPLSLKVRSANRHGEVPKGTATT